MDAMTIVEIRDGSGVVTSHLRVEGTVLTMGRSPECSVLIDDQFVDGHHLTVTILDDGSGTMIEDAGSKNGTKVDGRPLADGPKRVPFGTAILVGQTTVHLRDPDAPVAEAEELPANEGRLVDYSRLPGWRMAGLAVAMLTIWTGSAMYAPLGWAEGTGLLIGMVALFMLWTGFWAGMSRLFAGKARFRTHLGWAAACALVMVPISIPLGWVVFAVDHPFVDGVVNWIILGLGMWTLALYGHIDIASRRGHRFKVGLACLASAAVMGMAWGFTRTEGTPVEQVQRSLLVIAPIPDGLTRTASLDDFMADIDGLVAEHDEDVERAATK